MGRTVRYSDEYCAGFGDYVKGVDPTVVKNQGGDKCECIALYPSANVVGSWVLWNFRTNRPVRKTIFNKLHIPPRVIEIINDIAGINGIIKADVITDDITIENDDNNANEPSEETVVPGMEEVTNPPTTTEMEINDVENVGDGHLSIDDVQKMTTPELEVTGLSDVSQQSNIQTTELDDIIEPSGSQATGLGKIPDGGANNSEQNQGTESGGAIKMSRANRGISKWYNSDGFMTKSKYSAALKEIKDREYEEENNFLSLML